MKYEEAYDLVLDAIESEASLEISLLGVPSEVFASLAKQAIHALGYEAEATDA